MTVAGGPPSAAQGQRVPVLRRRPTIQSVAIASMVLTVGVWLFTGYSFVQRVRELERQGAEVSQRYAEAQALLTDVRRAVDHAAITVREALIDERPRLNLYRTTVDADLESAQSKLSAYVPVLDAARERQHVERLQVSIAELRTAYFALLAADAGQGSRDTPSLLLGGLTPKRDAAIRVSNDLQRLNRDAYLAQQKEMARVHGAIHERSWQTLLFGAFFGLVIGVAATLHVSRLERRLRAQQQRDAANVVALKDLSTRLVNAQEEERQVIARELHDGVGQLLTALKLELGQAERRTTGPVTLAEARALADQALTAVRDVSHLLHPPELQTLGLVDAIDAYVQAVRRRQDLEIQFHSAPFAKRLLPAVELAVYRIVQEAVTNVLRHARATECRISLVGTPGRVVLTIADNGVGFPQEAGSDGTRHGLGLVGIRERVQHTGGELRLESAPGRGTTLTAEFPVPEDGVDGAVDEAPALAPVH